MDLVPALLALGPMQPVELRGHQRALLGAEHTLDHDEPLRVERRQLRSGQCAALDAELTQCLFGVHLHASRFDHLSGSTGVAQAPEA